MSLLPTSVLLGFLCDLGLVLELTRPSLLYLCSARGSFDYLD